MSRSYKKYPGWSGRPAGPYEKKTSNHKVRKALSIANGSAFKKVYNSYNIRDFNFRYYSQREAIDKLTKYYDDKVYQSWIK
jgi:hypothetical protein